MLNLIKYWRAGAIALLLFIIVLQYFIADSKFQSCQANVSDVQAQLVAFKAATWQQEAAMQAELRAAEQEAIHSQSESDAKADAIMNQNIPQTQEASNTWVINEIKKIFWWHNNIP